MSNYTFTIVDTNNLLSADIKAKIKTDVTFAIETIRRYVDWKGVLDFQVQIKAGTESPYPNADGILPSMPGWFFNTPGRAELAAPVEAITGVDPNGATPDAGFTIYLAKDGQVRNYGDLVWMDPNPQFGVTPSIPAGQHDLVGIAIHELFHCFGFATWAQQKAAFDQQVITVNGNRYFNGANVLALLGEPLPIQADGDHYGSDVVSSPVKSGLMYIWGNYYGNRLDIGRLDLAVLKDLGWNIISTDNLALVDLLDYAPNVVGNGKMTALYGDSKNNVITGTSINETIVGGSGSDTIDGGAGTDTVQFQSKLSAYKVAMSGPNGTVADNAPALNGLDTLKNIEHLRFADFDINTGIKALAGSINTATVQRVMELYVAFFNRTPDADGLTYWLSQSKAGVSTTQIAESFYGVGVQYTALTGFSSTMTTTDFINVVYRNVLGRADGADAGGLDYWTKKLTSGEDTRGSLVSKILDAAHTYKGDATYGWVANLLDNKITVATKVAIDWGLNYLTADASVTNGMAIAKAVTSTDITAAIALVGVPEGAVVLG